MAEFRHSRRHEVIIGAGLDDVCNGLLGFITACLSFRDALPLFLGCPDGCTLAHC